MCEHVNLKGHMTHQEGGVNPRSKFSEMRVDPVLAICKAKVLPLPTHRLYETHLDTHSKF